MKMVEQEWLEYLRENGNMNGKTERTKLDASG